MVIQSSNAAPVMRCLAVCGSGMPSISWHVFVVAAAVATSGGHSQIAGGTRAVASLKKSFFAVLCILCCAAGHIAVSLVSIVYAINGGGGGVSDVAAGHKWPTTLLDFGYLSLMPVSIFLNLSTISLSMG